MFKEIMSLFKRSPKPVELIYTSKEAMAELVKIESMLDVNTITPPAEAFAALYNFKERTVLDIPDSEELLISLKLTTITTNTRIGLDLLNRAKHTPVNKSGLLLRYGNKESVERLFIEWFDNYDSFNNWMTEMSRWVALAMRVHYEVYGEGEPGPYDSPITPEERELVLNFMFLKLLDDYLTVLMLLIDSSPEGVSLVKTRP